MKATNAKSWGILFALPILILLAGQTNVIISWDAEPDPEGDVYPLTPYKAIPGSYLQFEVRNDEDLDTWTRTVISGCNVGSVTTGTESDSLEFNWLVSGGTPTTASGRSIWVAVNNWNETQHGPVNNGGAICGISDGRLSTDPRHDSRLTGGAFIVAVPDGETSEWMDHHTLDPHFGDGFRHRVSLSQDSTHPLVGITLEEEILYLADTLSPPLTPQEQAGVVSAGGNWIVTASHYRNNPDWHASNPTIAPYSRMQHGQTISILQKMKIMNNGFSGPLNQGPHYIGSGFLSGHVITRKLKMIGSQRNIVVNKSGASCHLYL